MKASILACCGLSIFISSGVAEKPEERDPHPKILYLTITRPWVEDLVVDLKGDTISYTHPGQHGSITEEIKPSAESWKEFRRALDAIKIWQWQSSYAGGHTIFDTPRWFLMIGYSDEKIQTKGENRVYPDEAGKPSQVNSDGWDKFMAALLKLMGRKEWD